MRLWRGLRIEEGWRGQQRRRVDVVVVMIFGRRLGRFGIGIVVVAV